MDIQKAVNNKELEEIEKNLMGLDDTFRFKCRHCGKCCVHQHTIILTARDIFNIARRLGKTTGAAINAFTEVYIGRDSHIPIVHLLMDPKTDACPLLKDGRCSIHDCKPSVCALFPLGRVAINVKDENGNPDPHHMQIKYLLNDVTCGSIKRVNTVRDWLCRFNVPAEDEFFLLWTRAIATMVKMIHKLEKGHFPEEGLQMLWNEIFQTLYLDYDTSQDFLSQFRPRAQKLIEDGEAILKVDKEA